jgi:hypothetical protein
VANCHNIGKEPCNICYRYGHNEATCRLKKRKKESRNTGDKKMKKAKINEMNKGDDDDDDDDDEHIVLLSEEDNMKLPFTFDSSEEGQYFNIN